MLARAAVDGQRAEPGRPDGPHGSRMRGGSPGGRVVTQVVGRSVQWPRRDPDIEHRATLALLRPRVFLGHLIAREFSQEECRDEEAG